MLFDRAGAGRSNADAYGSCIDLAHAVGIRAVAEGVETSAQVQVQEQA